MGRARAGGVRRGRTVDVRSGSSWSEEVVPAVRVERARFAEGARVELAMSDGRVWAVGFDAGSLRAERYLDWCRAVAAEPH